MNELKMGKKFIDIQIKVLLFFSIILFGLEYIFFFNFSSLFEFYYNDNNV